MKRNKRPCTSVAQTQKMYNIGFDIKSSDLLINSVTLNNENDSDSKEYRNCYIEFVYEDQLYSGIFMTDPNFIAWSLTKLIDMLPDNPDKIQFKICKKKVEAYMKSDLLMTFDNEDDLIDNIIDALRWSVVNNYIDRKYLEEKD